MAFHVIMLNFAKNTQMDYIEFLRKPYKIEDYTSDTGCTDYESDIEDIRLETKTDSELIFNVSIKNKSEETFRCILATLVVS